MPELQKVKIWDICNVTVLLPQYIASFRRKAVKEAYGMATQNLLRLPKVEAATGYRRSTIYRLIQEGTFPAPISLGARASAWIEDEVNAWIQKRIRSSREDGGAK